MAFQRGLVGAGAEDAGLEQARCGGVHDVEVLHFENIADADVAAADGGDLPDDDFVAAVVVDGEFGVPPPTDPDLGDVGVDLSDLMYLNFTRDADRPAW